MFLITFHENPPFRFHWFKKCVQRTLCSDFRDQLLFLFYENRLAKKTISNVPFLYNHKIRKIPDPSRQKRSALLCRKFSISARIHGTNIQNIESIVLILDLKPVFWIDCRQHEQCSSYFMKINISENVKQHPRDTAWFKQWTFQSFALTIWMRL